MGRPTSRAICRLRELIPANCRGTGESAKVRPLFNPVDAPPEPGYVPSAKLAEFVRCRDLTCRAPGCDVPASQCDIDHVVPFADGGPTHASNLSCKCRNITWRRHSGAGGTNSCPTAR